MHPTDDLPEPLKSLADLARASRRPTIEQARQAGRDAALNGPSTENCHCRYFGAPELTAAWEDGHREGKSHSTQEEQ